MTMALEGLSTSEIADVLDISPERVGMTLRRMGMQDKDGSTVVGELKDVISRYENSPVQKAAYIDSSTTVCRLVKSPRSTTCQSLK